MVLKSKKKNYRNKRKRSKRSKRNLKGGYSNNLDIAVIVEPRIHQHLVPVVNNFIDNLPKETKIQIFHGTKNLDFINKNFNELIKNGKIILTNLNVQNLSIKMYNQLLTSLNFWNKINGENILIFQVDSCLCKKGINKINKLLNYDYVGAPWKFKIDDNTLGGNGGLSFRKKKAMIYIIKNKIYENQNEDAFFSGQNISYPNFDIAKSLFSETIFSDNPIGIHKSWHHLSKNDFSNLKQSCPEINQIFKK